MKRRNLAILCTMALTMSVVVGFSTISQAGTPSAGCTVAELTAQKTDPKDPVTGEGGPLAVAGTHISWSAECLGNTTELPAILEVYDLSPNGGLLAEISSTLSGSGDLSASNDVYVPVQVPTGYEVCLTIATGDRHCVTI